ncbi:MAG: hypothetical protein QOC66_442 [Pseudonocardiales bacterium]|jgi:hypothetical protein|nr:hypothetical protein [Pseudonocardiales bacterium]
MTFQPPPPPPGGNPPPPPPPGQWGPPPGGGYPAPQGGFDPKNVNPLDWGVLGIGLLTFIFSFVDWYTFSEGGFSVSENAWHGFFGWFAMLLALIGSAVVAMDIFMPQVKLPFPNRLIGLAAYALATLCVILALFIVPGYLGIDVPGSVNKGHGFGYWISLILIIAGLVLSLMRLQQTGGKLPGALGNMPNIGARGPQGGMSGGQPGPGAVGPGVAPGPQAPPPPPPPGYGPPPQP